MLQLSAQPNAAYPGRPPTLSERRPKAIIVKVGEVAFLAEGYSAWFTLGRVYVQRKYKSPVHSKMQCAHFTTLNSGLGSCPRHNDCGAGPKAVGGVSNSARKCCSAVLL